MITYIIIGTIILLLVYIFIEYNNFVKLNNLAKEAFSTMDIYMKKRWDLIPNLVEVVKGYAKHESNTLENIITNRTLSYDNMGFNDKVSTNIQLHGVLKSIFAVAENYPNLKASKNFLDLSSQLSKIEDEIANSRKYYNGVIKKLNTKTEMFPSSIIAKIFGFKKQKMFEINTKERNNINIDL